MRRIPRSFRIVGIIFLAAILARGIPARAALCGKCQDMMFTDSVGKCIACGGPTGSAALKLCPKCSAKRRQCEHCLAPLTEKDESRAEEPVEAEPAGPARENPLHGAAAEKAPPAKVDPDHAQRSASSDGSAALAQPAASEPALLPSQARPESRAPADPPPAPEASKKAKPINPARPGTYTHGKWRFQMQFTNPAARNEGRWGWLTYEGRMLPRGGVNDYYETPWGPIYWVGVPTTAWGLHGWMPIPLPQNQRQGRALLTPVQAEALSGVPTSPQSAPSARKVQKLEINKSHNGQLARLRVGNVLIIRLPGNPASGYQWEVGTTNSRALRLTVRPQYSPPSPTASGSYSQGSYTFIYQAVQPGAGSIRLYYVRPGEPNRPRDAFAVGVNVSPAAAAASARPAGLGQSSGSR